MQIMSSPSMSDAADTPVSGSGGSPSPHSPVSKQILYFSRKGCSELSQRNGIPSTKTPDTVESERSVNSSPATLVPTPRSTPPMNGILTPPNDTETNTEPTKSAKPGGRLKFFKDGILCLELTHHGEGERTKWVQIRAKTVFPTLVHTVQKATIPCQSTPSSFASPSSLTHNRMESSTSHSLSDDASSMLSSPQAREIHWKQPVPQRGVSVCLQFYMKPAPCALTVRSKLKEFYHSQDQLRKRWPYRNCRKSDIFVKLQSSVQCSCDELSRVLKDSSRSSPNSDTSDKHITHGEPDEDVVVTRRKSSVKKSSLQSIVGQLEKLAESQSQISRELSGSKLCKSGVKTNGDVNNDKRHNSSNNASGKSSTVTPKKRLFNEIEPRETASTIRPKKKSPNRSHESGKTILNVPGLNSEFYKRLPLSKAKSPGRHSPMTGSDPYEQRSSKSSLLENAVHKRSNRSPNVGAKSLSPVMSSGGGGPIPKPSLSAELVDHFSGRSASRPSYDEGPSRHQTLMQERKYLQHQTVSKAISYTINSLLGTGSEPQDSPSANRHGGGEQSRYLQSTDSKGHNSSAHNNQRRHNPLATNSRPDQDQKSFLRHLLDMSDPIPSAKSVDKTRNMGRSSSQSVNNNRSSSSSSGGGSKALKAANNHEKVSTAASSSKANNSSSQGPRMPAESSYAEAHQSIATNLALSSLMSSFPIPPYDMLSRGANPHSTEALAAAAAALQYGSLIPGNLFNPVNSTMAAAMASYFGVVPSFPVTAPSPKSESPSVVSAPRRNHQESVNHHHQRSWPIDNGHPSAGNSPPFRSSGGTAPTISHNSSPRPATSSAISALQMSSCGALNLSEKKKTRKEEPIDMDAPLDLCKKSSR